MKRSLSRILAIAVPALLAACGGGGGGGTGSLPADVRPPVELPPFELAGTEPPSPTPSAEQVIAEHLAGPIEQGRSPGILAAVVDANGVVGAAAAGVRRQGSPEPFRTTDLVRINSNTKAMTATMLATLVADRTFPNGWRTTIADVFPELRGEIHADYHDVELDQLLRMTSGIKRDADDWNDPDHLAIPDIKDRRYALLQDNLQEPRAGLPGEYLYSNLGYMIAGAMAERLTGKSWEVLMQERLFEPLGITTGGFGAPSTPGNVDQPWSHYRDRDGNWVATQRDLPPQIGPAGTVHISVEDWARFIALWFPTRTPAILDRATLDMLATARSHRYAAGWAVWRRDGVTYLAHDGQSWWHSRLVIDTAGGKAWLVAINGWSRDDDALRSTVVNNIFDDTARISRKDMAGPDFAARIAAVLASNPSFLNSDVLVLSDGETRTMGKISCDGGHCELNDQRTTAAAFLYADGLQYMETRRGVDLTQGHQQFGGWLSRSAFGVYSGVRAAGTPGTAEYLHETTVHSYSVGVPSNTNPSIGSASWEGIVVGADISHAGTTGNFVRGDASLAVDFAATQIDVTFENIEDLSANTRHPDITWTDLPLMAGGFRSDTIEGRFYGQDHGEVGGVFNRDNLHGAFGATRQ